MSRRLQTGTKKRTRRGFTLIELLVVIMILAVLAALIIPRIIGRQGDAKVAAAKSNLAQLNSLLELFRSDLDRYPTTEEGLYALTEEPADSEGWHGPYMTKEIAADPWKNDYVYENDGEFIFLASYGRDGVPEGEGEDADLIERDD